MNLGWPLAFPEETAALAASIVLLLGLVLVAVWGFVDQKRHGRTAESATLEVAPGTEQEERRRAA